MKKERFSIKIKAPKEKVWNVLWNDATYSLWTSVFSGVSYADTDWKEGSKVLFLSSKGDGMVSSIAKNIPNEFMSFRHMGVVKNGKEEPLSEETKQWSGAMENYTLKETEGVTELIVEMDVTDDYQNYFRETFPKALEKVKAIAESKAVQS